MLQESFEQHRFAHLYGVVQRGHSILIRLAHISTVFQQQDAKCFVVARLYHQSIVAPGNRVDTSSGNQERAKSLRRRHVKRCARLQQ